MLVDHAFSLKKRKKNSRFSVEKSFRYDFAQTFTVSFNKKITNLTANSALILINTSVECSFHVQWDYEKNSYFIHI